MKRLFFFIVTNLAVLLVLTVVARVLGIDAYLTAHGQSLQGLLVWAALFGFGGAFVSLAMSKMQAKMFMGVEVISPQSADATRQWLLSVVEHHARSAGVGMPEVGVFNSPEPNAFATGMSRNSALVAVSTGLLERMNRQEIEAVLGHEMTHVANGDMVTLTLIQGVVNTFVLLLSRVVGNLIDRAVFRSDDGRGIASLLIFYVLQIAFGILATPIVMWFSRYREFRADRGGAHLAGTPNMIAALEELKRVHEPLPAQQFAAFGIAGGDSGGGLRRLFMSHPPLDERIAALRALGPAN
ncbi:MAG TPA: protease HtpX [Steroidobacteraceae bacterium]|jgi:heat shock protein HtpX|nr:protease HtpX [Steroidobacteraceae bacterium]